MEIKLSESPKGKYNKTSLNKPDKTELEYLHLMKYGIDMTSIDPQVGTKSFANAVNNGWCSHKDICLPEEELADEIKRGQKRANKEIEMSEPSEKIVSKKLTIARK